MFRLTDKVHCHHHCIRGGVCHLQTIHSYKIESQPQVSQSNNAKNLSVGPANISIPTRPNNNRFASATNSFPGPTMMSAGGKPNRPYCMQFTHKYTQVEYYVNE